MTEVLNQWHAELSLSFSLQNATRSILARRHHKGPLLIQKALYPEGPEICHVTILHPPSGIAGGDVLDIRVHVDHGAHAVLANTGATRWYKANGRESVQTVTLDVSAHSKLEWLPCENIFSKSLMRRTRPS
ncbi:urease accessory protein UreD [Paenalcaligenes niemegkensis]|nr:urease accessory protein UreD [Paenalcaligenes niemegkensis]MCQ9617840.1 urease accessory protein UreD [Paenalcaligenes niemegkensis]